MVHLRTIIILIIYRITDVTADYIRYKTRNFTMKEGFEGEVIK